MLRPIVDSDFSALIELRGKAAQNAMSPNELEAVGVTEASMKAAIKGTHRGWLVENEGRPVGFAMGDAQAGELTVIALLPDFEGKGFGSDLLAKVETWLGQQGCKEIWLTTDVDQKLRAYGFYISQGWKDDKLENGLRYMAKDLTR